MGLLSSIGKGLGELTGFGSGGSSAIRGSGGTSITVDPLAYSELYQQAMDALTGVDVNMSEKDAALQGSVRDAARAQLAGLENNAEGRKAAFMEDTSRGLTSDLSNLGRASYGNMANAYSGKNLGSVMDSTARARSSALPDLYSRAISDLGSIEGIQGNLLSQNQAQQNMQMAKANNIAQGRMQELANRRNVMTGNASTNFQANTAITQQRRDTANRALSALVSGLKPTGDV